MKKKILAGAIISASVLISTQVVAQEYIYRMPIGASNSVNNDSDSDLGSNPDWNQGEETNGSCDAGYTSISGTCYINKYDENSTSAPASVIDNLVNNDSCETKYTFSSSTGTKSCTLNGSPEDTSMTWVEFLNTYSSNFRSSPSSDGSGGYSFMEGFALDGFTNFNSNLIDDFPYSRNYPSSTVDSIEIDFDSSLNLNSNDFLSSITEVYNNMDFSNFGNNSIDLEGTKNVVSADSVYIIGKNINNANFSSLNQVGDFVFETADTPTSSPININLNNLEIATKVSVQDQNGSLIEKISMPTLQSVDSISVSGNVRGVDAPELFSAYSIRIMGVNSDLGEYSFSKLNNISEFLVSGNSEYVRVPSLNSVGNRFEVSGSKSVLASNLVSSKYIEVEAKDNNMSLIDLSSYKGNMNGVSISTSNNEVINELDLSSMETVSQLSIDGTVNNYNNFNSLLHAGEIYINGDITSLPTFNSTIDFGKMEIIDNSNTVFDNFNILPSLKGFGELYIGLLLNDVTGIENIDLNVSGKVCVKNYDDISVKPASDSVFSQSVGQTFTETKYNTTFDCFTQ